MSDIDTEKNEGAVSTESQDNGKILIDDIKTYLTENAEAKEVKDLISSFSKFTPDLVDKLIEDDESWTKWFSSRTDKRVTDAIKTREKALRENLSREIENKVREEMMPTETPDQRAIRELKVEMAEQQKQIRAERLEKAAMRIASNLEVEGIGDHLEMFIGENEDEIKKHIEWLRDRDRNKIEEGKHIHLKSSAHKPTGGDDDPKLPYKTLEEYTRYIQKNPDKYDPEMYTKVAEYEAKRRK